jgi:hypothetical protein
VAGELTRQVVGPYVDHADKVKGYWFWGLVATFIAVPEVLAAISDPLEAHIPWPTISNLVGKDLEAHHHWVALIVVWLIAVVTVHTLAHPQERKRAGRALRVPEEDVTRLGWGWRYICATRSRAARRASSRPRSAATRTRSATRSTSRLRSSGS